MDCLIAQRLPRSTLASHNRSARPSGPQGSKEAPGFTVSRVGRLEMIGYAPSQYVIDSRYAEGDDARLAELAADLVRGKPDVMSS
jgi:hypothetical protein